MRAHLADAECVAVWRSAGDPSMSNTAGGTAIVLDNDGLTK
jgi:hypothetical protein